VQQTVITFDIDTTVPKYQFSFSGGISVGSGAAGGSAQATGNIDIQPGTLQVNLSGSGSLSLAGLSASLTGFYFNIDYSNGTMQSLAVGGNLSISVLGVGLYGSIGFQYADGGLLAFHVGIGASLDFYVGSVGGTVYVDYCKGSLGNEPTNSTSCTTDPTAYGGTHHLEEPTSPDSSRWACGDHWLTSATPRTTRTSSSKTWGNPQHLTRSQAHPLRRPVLLGRSRQSSPGARRATSGFRRCHRLRAAASPVTAAILE
jgi:hypothetical protein